MIEKIQKIGNFFVPTWLIFTGPVTNVLHIKYVIASLYHMPVFINYYHKWFCCMEYYGINITVVYYRATHMDRLKMMSIK